MSSSRVSRLREKRDDRREGDCRRRCDRQQGGGLARTILDDPTGEFACRALTRRPTSDAALALSDRGAEVVQATSEDSREWLQLDDDRMPAVEGRYKVPH